MFQNKNSAGGGGQKYPPESLLKKYKPSSFKLFGSRAETNFGSKAKSRNLRILQLENQTPQTLENCQNEIRGT